MTVNRFSIQYRTNNVCLFVAIIMIELHFSNDTKNNKYSWMAELWTKLIITFRMNRIMNETPAKKKE